jgi:hypothetical protein
MRGLWGNKRATTRQPCQGGFAVLPVPGPTEGTTSTQPSLFFSAADVGIFVRSRVARNPAISQAGLIRPFVRILRLPRPHDPTARLFVRDDLSLPHLPQERLVTRTERRARPGQPRTAADARRAGIGTIVARTNATSVEVLWAVRHGGCPFSDHGPQKLVGSHQTARLVAGCGYMLRLRLSDALAKNFK